QTMGATGDRPRRTPGHPRRAQHHRPRAGTSPASRRQRGHGMTSDSLLAALADARHRKEQADRDIRLLLAYARELAAPRPYRLADLAHAAGMSISGVRIAYTPGDIQQATSLIAAGRPPGGGWNIPACVAALLATGQRAPTGERSLPA